MKKPRKCQCGRGFVYKKKKKVRKPKQKRGKGMYLRPYKSNI